MVPRNSFASSQQGRECRRVRPKSTRQQNSRSRDRAHQVPRMSTARWATFCALLVSRVRHVVRCLVQQLQPSNECSQLGGRGYFRRKGSGTPQQYTPKHRPTEGDDSPTGGVADSLTAASAVGCDWRRVGQRWLVRYGKLVYEVVVHVLSFSSPVRLIRLCCFVFRFSCFINTYRATRF